MSVQNTIAATRWLTATSDSFRAAVLDAVRVRKIEQGSWLYGVEHPISGPVVVLSGALAFDLPIGLGSQFAEWLVQPGHWVGAGASIMQGTRQANLRAVVPTEVAELSAASVRRIADSEPDGWRYFAMIVVMNSHVSISVAGALMARRAEARIAAMLLLLSQSGFAGDKGRLPIPLPQAEIARLCALARPVLSRWLAGFDEKGLTRSGYRVVEVLDATGLAALVD